MFERWLRRVARVIGASIGAFAALVAIQMLRLRRLQFLPGDPGFDVDLVIPPPSKAKSGEAPVRLLVLGDSTTAGVGVARAEEALPAQLARILAGSRGRAVHVTSLGRSGARVAHVLAEQLPQVSPDADLVAIVVGANDATHRTNPWRFRRQLSALLRAVRDAAPRADVVLAGIPSFRGALRGIEPLMLITDHYARVLRAIERREAAEAGAAYADLATHVAPRVRGRPETLSIDSFHPSAAGYAVWAEAIARAVVPQRTATDAVTRGQHEPAGA